MATTVTQMTPVFNYDPNAIPSNTDNSIVRLLAGCDTIHDVKEEPAGRVTTVAWNGGVYDAHLVHLNGLIPVAQLSTLSQGGGGATDWLRAASGGRITASSSVEDQTVAAFENIFPIELNKNLTVKTTYRAILDAITAYRTQGDDINTAIFNAGNYIVGLNNILDVEVIPGEIFEANYSAAEKIYIALFMLNFFFPPSAGDPAYNSRLPTYMTFDAGSNIPDKLFGPLDQVINLVTPLNIADSSTVTSHLLAGKKGRKNGVKNKYEFPVHPNAIGGGYHYTSNISTFGNYRFVIPRAQGQTYTETTKHDFTIDLYGLLPGQQPIPVSQIIFDDQHKNGPSIAYLTDLIAGLNPAAGNGMADLTSFFLSIRAIPGMSNILLDIKRGGDWEQCNAAHVINTNSRQNSAGRVILCTLDRLCALYSRCLRQNTILHYDTKLKLYRFLGSGSPELVAAQERALNELRAKALAEKGTCVNAILAALHTLLSNIGTSFIPTINATSADDVFSNILKWMKLRLLTLLRNKIGSIFLIPYQQEKLQEYVVTIEGWFGVDLTTATYPKIVESITGFDPRIGRGQKLGEYDLTPLISTAKPMMQKILQGEGKGFGRRSLSDTDISEDIHEKCLDILKDYLSKTESLEADLVSRQLDDLVQLYPVRPIPAPGTPERSQNNLDYVARLSAEINAIGSSPGNGGGRAKVQGAPKKLFRGGELTDEQNNNADNDCYNEIVNNFVGLCANISERFGVRYNFDLHMLLTSYGDVTIDIPREDLSIVTILLDFFKETYSVMANTDELLEANGHYLADAPTYIFIYAMVSFIYFDYDAYLIANPTFLPLFDFMHRGGTAVANDINTVAEFLLLIIENFNGTEFLTPNYKSNVRTYLQTSGTYVSAFKIIIQLLFIKTESGSFVRTSITPNGLIIRLFVFLKNYLQFVVAKVAHFKQSIRYSNYQVSDFGYNGILLNELNSLTPPPDPPPVPPSPFGAPVPPKPPNYKNLYDSLNRIVKVDASSLTDSSDNFKKIYQQSKIIFVGLLYAIRNEGDPSKFASALANLSGGGKSKRLGKKTLKKHKTKLSKNKKKKNNKRRRTIKV